MRFFVFLFGGIVLLGLSSYLYLRRMGLDTKGTTISQSITLAFKETCTELPTLSASS